MLIQRILCVILFSVVYTNVNGKHVISLNNDENLLKEKGKEKIIKLPMNTSSDFNILIDGIMDTTAHEDLNITLYSPHAEGSRCSLAYNLKVENVDLVCQDMDQNTYSTPYQPDIKNDDSFSVKIEAKHSTEPILTFFFEARRAGLMFIGQCFFEDLEFIALSNGIKRIKKITFEY